MLGYAEAKAQFKDIFTFALADEDFRKRLLEEPLAVFREHGIDLPEGATLKFFENTDETVHFVIPSHIPENESYSDCWINEMFEDFSRVLFKETSPMRYWEEAMLEAVET